MNHLTEAQKLAEFVISLDNFETQTRSKQTYQHMGAIITDAILQSGLNYKAVVAPRVHRLIEQYPNAYTTKGFLDVIYTYGLNSILNWNHPEKPQRIHKLTLFFYRNQIDTEDMLKLWLQESGNEFMLLELNGIGQKTVDYLKMLVRLQSVAVDRHIRTFIKNAGLTYTRYEDIQQVVEITADILSLDRNSFDLSIWSYISARRL
jgi:endonuclease III